MEQIIRDLVNDLLSQRDRLVRKLTKLDPNNPQYAIKEMNLKAMLFDTDTQIQSHLNTLNNHLTQSK